MSQLGEVLLYGRAEAEIPLLQSKIQTKIKKTRDLEGERKIENGKRNKMRDRESNPRLCMRPMVKSMEKKREMRLQMRLLPLAMLPETLTPFNLKF